MKKGNKKRGTNQLKQRHTQHWESLLSRFFIIIRGKATKKQGAKMHSFNGLFFRKGVQFDQTGMEDVNAQITKN